MQKLLLAIALILGSALPGLADAITDRVVANLEKQGFTVVRIDRTWLGRMWILAERRDVRREIVFNPVTGEILRDYAVKIALNERSDSDRSDTQSAGRPPSFEADPEPEITGSKLEIDAGQASSIVAPGEIMLDPVNPIAPQ